MTLPKPTEGELAILRVIWERGSCTVRDIHQVLGRTQYTTVLKLLQIMTEKGLVRREALGRTHVYRACRSEAQTQRQLVKDLLARAFGGSAVDLVVQALAAKRATPSELKAIQKLIDRSRKTRHGH
jgi:BlaI family penicillinase repressor